MIGKPYTETGMIAALRFVEDSLRNGAPTGPVPASMEMAPPGHVLGRGRSEDGLTYPD